MIVTYRSVFEGAGGDSDLSERFRGGGGLIVIFRSVFEGVGGDSDLSERIRGRRG